MKKLLKYFTILLSILFIMCVCSSCDSPNSNSQVPNKEEQQTKQPGDNLDDNSDDNQGNSDNSRDTTDNSTGDDSGDTTGENTGDNSEDNSDDDSGVINLPIIWKK